MESKWISVKERLPEVGEVVNVLVLERYAGKSIASVSAGVYSDIWEDGRRMEWRPDLSFISGYDYGCEDMNVTHWRPLPLPPGEEGSK